MAEVFENVIKVETSDSERSVKSLKAEIVALRDKLLNLDETTDEYADIVKQLQKDQNDLNRVMGATKQANTALVGSYDALTKEMSDLKKEWKATNDAARRNELAEQINNINNQLKQFDSEVGNFQRNVGYYQSALDGLETKTVNFGDAMREMNDTIEPTKAKFESVQKLSAGIASGFAALQGVTALLGIENENLEKSLVKVQAAMAIAQGVGGLGDLVEGLGKAKVAFSDLGKTIKTVSAVMGKTGWIAVIIAVISAITLIINAINKKKNAVDALEQSLSKLDKANKNLSDSYTERSRQLEREIKVMEAQGAKEEDVIKKRIELAKQYAEAAKKNKQEAEKQYRGLKDSLTMGIKGVTQEDVDKAKENYDNAVDAYKDYVENVKDLENDLVVAGIKAKKKLEDNLTSGVTLPIIPEIDLSELEQELTKVEKIVEVGYVYKDGDAEKRAGIKTNQINSSTSLSIRQSKLDGGSQSDQIAIALEGEKAKLKALQDFYKQAMENGDPTGMLALEQQILEQTTAIAEQEVELEKAKQDEIIAIQEEAYQKRVDILNKVNASLAAAADFTQGISEIYQACYEADGEVSEKEAKKLKNIQIAVATISMLQGIVAALSGAFTTKSGPWDIALAATQAAAIAASGTANIIKIKNTDMTGGSTSSAVATPNSSAFVSELPVQYTRNLTSSSEIDELNKDQRVYILESDIQASGKRVAIRQSESSF